jgi:hypothetical protein
MEKALVATKADPIKRWREANAFSRPLADAGWQVSLRI